MSKKTWFYSATAAVTVLSLFLVPWAGAAERQDVSSSSDSMIEKEIAVYSHWLEDAYGAVAEERALMNDDLEQPTAKEREVIDGQTDYIVNAFVTSGLSIEDASVSFRIGSMTQSGSKYVVSAEVTTKITYSRIDENMQVVHDACWWTDPHVITIADGREDAKTGSGDFLGNYEVISDGISSEIDDESERDASGTSDEGDTSKGVTYEEALALRPKGGELEINPATAGTPSIPYYMKGVRYALKWTDYPYFGDEKSDFNPDYPYFENNCTNFISQAIHESDVPYRTAISVDTKDINLWTPNLMFGKPTWTWNNADYSYRFMKNTYFKAFDSPWMDVGGLIYVDWNGKDNDNTKNHAMIVTQADRSYVNGQMIFNTYISQKTNNRHNIPLSVEMGIAYQTHPDATWYGLGLRWQ